MLVSQKIASIQLEWSKCLIFIIKSQDLRSIMAGWNKAEFQVDIT